MGSTFRRLRFLRAAAVITVAASAVAALGLTSASAATSPVSLGSIASYAAFGSAITNTGPTQLTGDAGTSPGSAPIGFPPGHLSGSVHLGDAAAATARNDLQSAYDSAESLTPGQQISGDLAGLVLAPGVYHSAAALSLSTTLSLDGHHDSSSVFVVQIDAAFALAASARIVLLNGTQADHVFWQVRGAVTLGASAAFAGTILGLAAITVGANASVTGRVLSINGAVTLSTNSIAPQAAINLQSASSYSVLAATTVSNSGSSTVSGDVGVSPGTAITGFPPGILGGDLHAGDGEANQAQVDLHGAFVDAQGRTSTAVIPGTLDGLTLAPGVQHSFGSVALGSAVTLDGQNNPNSLFIFQVNGSLTTAASSRVRLINGADSNRIFWQVSGSSTLGAASTFMGSLMSAGAIAVRSGARLTGRVLSLGGAVTLDSAVSETLIPLDLGSAINYSALAATTVQNTGATVVNLSVGVSPGTAISGFPPGTTTEGTFHAGDADSAAARADAYTAFSDASRRTPTRAIAGDLAGLTFISGVYHAAAALTLSGTMILDARGDSNAVFIFQVGAAFNTAANSVVQLANGAQLSNIFWQVQGAATLGAGSQFSGTVLCTGAITAGDQMSLSGRLISLSGAITLGRVSVISPTADPGALSATSSATALSDVTLNGVSTQYATGSSEGWSVSDVRGSGAAWSLTVSATDFVSDPGTVDAVARSLPAAALSVDAGPVTAAAGSDPVAGIFAAPLTLSSVPQIFLSSSGYHRGSYFFSPSFSLAVPATAYRANFSGPLNDSPLNPYIATITVTIS
jgi:hypothetical protein